MIETQSGMRKVPKREMLPSVDFFPRVEYNGKTIDAAAFGSRVYCRNVVAMQKRYFHSNDLPNVTFRPLTTAESLAVAGYDFRNLARLQIFNSSRLQAGPFLRTEEGVWINPLKDDRGEVITDKKELEQHLGKTNRVNGIYLLNGDTTFVPYDSFKSGVQEHGTFLEGGLARGLVHTAEKKATTLSCIADKSEYPDGVDVQGFGSAINPTLMVASLSSDRNINAFDVSRLHVDGYRYADSKGYAFGGLVSGEAGAKN